jgi:hypothetical protein
MSLPNMTGYNEFTAAASKGNQLEHVSGIGASERPERLLSTLKKLDLISDRMFTACSTILAAGNPCGEFCAVSVVDLDRRLRATDATPEQRLAFKLGLERAGMMFVPKG